MQGVSKGDLQLHSKRYCEASVTKMFTPKDVQNYPWDTFVIIGYEVLTEVVMKRYHCAIRGNLYSGGALSESSC
jgi:hypothetical protein